MHLRLIFYCENFEGIIRVQNLGIQFVKLWTCFIWCCTGLLLNTATKFWIYKSKGCEVWGVIDQLCECQLLKAAHVLWN
jgi:hypothetical protein